MFRFVVITCCLALALGLPTGPKAIPRLDGRIVGGDPADIEDFPYQISYQYYGSHICGGSILDSNHVLTAAHCTDGMSARALTIRAGSTYHSSGGQVVQVQAIHQNPEFSMADLEFDVSVLDLADSIDFSDSAQPISLTETEPSGNTAAIVSGWGTTSSGGSSPLQLRQVGVNIVSRDECISQYGRGQISENMICAAATGKDSCQGDSGGPLVTKDKSQQIGIVSWGYGCADPDYPGVYSNVAVLSSFINKYV